MRRVVLLSVALVCAAWLALAGSADARHDLYAPGKHWPGGPKALVMISDQTGGLYPVSEAISVWERRVGNIIHFQQVGPTCPSTTPHQCVTLALAPRLNRESGYVYGESWVYHEGDHLLKTDVFLSNDPASHETRRDILAHELGHALGLGHSNYGLMKAWVSPGAQPTGHDVWTITRNRVH